MTRVVLRQWAALGFVLAIGCGTSDAPTRRTETRGAQAPSDHAAQVVEQWTAATPSRPPVLPEHLSQETTAPASPRPVLASGVARQFVRHGNWLEPMFDGSGPSSPPATTSPTPTKPPAGPAARTKMPAHASDAFSLTDAASGVSIAVRLRGANGASIEAANGYLVYPAAYEGNADVLQRPYPSGTEQSLAFPLQPAAEQVTYDVSLVHGVAGVRLVDNDVEFLDAQGAPRLRMAPPLCGRKQLHIHVASGCGFRMRLRFQPGAAMGADSDAA